MPDGGVRFSLALTGNMLTASPTWTQVDSALVSSVSIGRGRQDEFNRTGTGTASVKVNDTEGVFDPTKVGATYRYLGGKQAKIDLYDPVANVWKTIFRGFVDDKPSEAAPSQVVTRSEIQLVDGFDYLARSEAAPGYAGTVPVPAGAEGNIFYDNANVDDRIIEVLADSLWPAALSVVFSGNVEVQESIYDPGTSFLGILADAADAEFPDVANIYMDRIGRFHFHGRFSRFDPEGTAAGATPGAWDFTRWKVGDGAAIVADANTVQIRALGYAEPMQLVYNTALCYPKGIADSAIEGQVVVDAASQAAYGLRPWSATDLTVQSGTTSGLNANLECKSFAQYIIDNYADPVERVNLLSFKSIGETDARAAKVWQLLTKIDISDIVELTTSHPGGGGFAAAPFFVEGLSYEITPLNGDYAMVELNADVSPVGYYNTPF